ncbi:MAG: molybdopterin-dependent oxidoreductase, partial [Pseudomonadota bacterium]
MKFSRRSFLKSTSAALAGLFSGKGVRPVRASENTGIVPGKEIRGRCPLCSLGCGLTYRYLGPDNWHVEGDPDCPVASGSLCSRGTGLIESLRPGEASAPLYRPPGGNGFEEISWDRAVHLLARRLKDLRDRDLGLFSAEGEKASNRFDSLGVIAGGCLTNEEAYLVSKIFRGMGVSGIDTTVRASHGMAVSGLLDTLGLPGGTHTVPQTAFSDVVVLMGCNPGQTAPALCRYLDKVRERRGTVIILDPRQSETMKKDDLWLQLRPGTDNAVLGAFMHWILQYAGIPRSLLIERSDAPYMVMSEIMGAYERHTSGKYKNWIKVDESLSEPYSVFQRMKRHYGRYELDKIADIAGVNVHLLRRACTLLARTASP